MLSPLGTSCSDDDGDVVEVIAGSSPGQCKCVCPVCDKDLEHLADNARNRHVQSCLSPPSITSTSYSCPECFVPLNGSSYQQRASHLKKCMATQSYSLKPLSSAKKRAKVDEDLEIGIHMSKLQMQLDEREEEVDMAGFSPHEAQLFHDYSQRAKRLVPSPPLLTPSPIPAPLPPSTLTSKVRQTLFLDDEVPSEVRNGDEDDDDDVIQISPSSFRPYQKPPEDKKGEKARPEKLIVLVPAAIQQRYDQGCDQALSVYHDQVQSARQEYYASIGRLAVERDMAIDESKRKRSLQDEAIPSPLESNHLYVVSDDFDDDFQLPDSPPSRSGTPPSVLARSFSAPQPLATSSQPIVDPVLLQRKNIAPPEATPPNNASFQRPSAMPPYASMSREQLVTLMKGYGLKLGKTTEMVEKLTEIWTVTHSGLVTSSLRKAKNIQSLPLLTTPIQSERPVDRGTLQGDRPRGDQLPAKQLVLRWIRAHPTYWTRVLLYDSIPLLQLHEDYVAETGRSVSRDALRSILSSQSIIFMDPKSKWK